MTEKPSKKGKPLLDTYGNEFELPDFTIKQIHDAIPKHCFERSALRSLGYVLRDAVLISSNFSLFKFYIIPALAEQHVATRVAAWGVYALLQGLFGTGIWVLAHECGHGAFSANKVVNDTVGWILHSSLLVPFWSWKISHGKHHKATANIERDMVFVPKSREEYSRRYAGGIGHDIAELTEETPIATLIHLIAQQIFGWPMYLISNVTGHNFHERQSEGRGVGKANGFGGKVNHFDPGSPLYEAKDAKWILMSDIGISITIFLLYQAVQAFGALNVFIWYGIPYIMVNHWLGKLSPQFSLFIPNFPLTWFLVAITFLQHTDPSLPHYHAESWNFVRGASATIDRDFGFIGRHLLHGIIETHVAHHFVSTIPFYKADEATEAIKKVMGKHYRSNTKGGSLGFLTALWTSARWCQFVEPSAGAEGEGKGVVFFRNRNGLGIPPAPLAEKVVGGVKEKKAGISVQVSEVSDSE